jgi:phage terminase small subunit
MTDTGLNIPMPETSDLGPAMRALNERQRKFVVAYFHTGSREKAAYIAGYAGELNSNLIGVSAYSVWHNPKVQTAIKEFGEQSVLAGLVPLAFAALESALQLGDNKDKITAAKIVMDRTGFHAKSEVITSKGTQTREDQIKEIVRLAKLQGLDPRKLIGGAVDFIDADYEVVDKAEGVKRAAMKQLTADVVKAVAEPESSSEGLEDLL